MVAVGPGDLAPALGETSHRRVGDRGAGTEHQNRERGRRNPHSPRRSEKLDTSLILLHPRVLDEEVACAVADLAGVLGAGATHGDQATGARLSSPQP